MEASAAGTAGAATADAGGQGTNDGGNEAAETQQNGLPENLVETLDGLRTGQEELRQFLQSQSDAAAGGEDEGEEEADDLDLSFLDPASAEFDPAEVATRLGGLIEQTAEKRAQALVDKRVGPMETRLSEMARTAEAERLVQEFPEFGDEEVATEVVKVSRQIAEAHMPNDPDAAKQLADQPWFWRLTYMAARAAETANGEGNGIADPAHLEGGGGGGAGSGSEVDLGEQIVAPSRGGRSVLPF